MKRIIYALSAAALIAFASCNVNYKSTPSGMKYKILTGKATGADTVGVAAKAGSIIKFRFKFSIPEVHDTVFRTAYNMMPQYTQVDTSARTKMTFMEIFPKVKSGDSAEVIISIDSIIPQVQAQGGQLPPLMTKGRHVKINFSVLNVFDNEKEAQADMQKEQEKQKALSAGQLKKAAEDLDKYIKDKGIKATKTAHGAYVVIEKPGDISQKADSGTVVSVKYTGRTLAGKVFDSNIDSTVSGHTDPIQFPIGQHRVIQGWDEAMPYFGKGGKGTIYVPAELGYGDRESGEIPAFSNLVFDVEVVDVKPADAGN